MRISLVLAALGLLMTASAVQADFVWLRQTGNSNPNGNGVYQNGSADTGGGAMLPFFLTNNTTTVLQLSHGSMGVSAYTAYGLKTSGMYAIAWTPAGFFNGDPLGWGDLVGRVSVPMPTITTVGAGIIIGQPITNYTATWDSPGSLLDVDFIIQPGQSAYFTIAVPLQGTWLGSWFPRESASAAPSDTLYGSGGFGYQPFEQISWTQFNGHLEGNWAFVVVRQKGDLNCDGNVNTLDVQSFVTALLDPSAYATAHPDCQINNADMNGDSLIDGRDIAGIAECLSTSTCP